MFGKSIVLLAVAASSAVAQLMIQSPASLITCQPVLLSWSGGQAPYYLAAIPGNQPSAAAIKDFGTQTGTSYTWTVDLASGQSITLKITDSTGAVNYNSAVTIQAGSSTSCLTSGSSSSAASGSSAAVVAGASSVASSATSGAAAVVSSASSAAASAASSAKSAVSSVASAASSAVSSATNKSTTAASGTTASTNTASAAAAAATTSKAAAFPLVQTSGGLIAAVAGLVGVALF